MSIDAINAIGENLVLQSGVEQKLPVENTQFADWFKTELTQLNEQIVSSEHKLEQLASGENNNLHEVMMSLEKAKLSFQLALQVRNKLMEGYQEIMRMQI